MSKLNRITTGSGRTIYTRTAKRGGKEVQQPVPTARVVGRIINAESALLAAGDTTPSAVAARLRAEPILNADRPARDLVLRMLGDDVAAAYRAAAEGKRNA